MKIYRNKIKALVIFCIGLPCFRSGLAAVAEVSSAFLTADQQDCFTHEIRLPEEYELKLNTKPTLGAQYFTLACRRSLQEEVFVFNNDGQYVDVGQKQGTVITSGTEFASSGNVIVAKNTNGEPVIIRLNGEEACLYNLPPVIIQKQNGNYVGSCSKALVGCGGERLVTIHDFFTGKLRVLRMFDMNGKEIGFVELPLLQGASSSLTSCGEYFLYAYENGGKYRLLVIRMDGALMPITISDDESYRGCNALQCEGYERVIKIGPRKDGIYVATVGDSLIVRRPGKYDIMFVPTADVQGPWRRQEFFLDGERIDYTSIRIIASGRFLGITCDELPSRYLFTPDGQHIPLVVNGRTITFDECHVGLNGRYIVVGEYSDREDSKYHLFEIDGLLAKHRTLTIDGREIEGARALHESSHHILAYSNEDEGEDEAGDEHPFHVFDADCQYMGDLSVGDVYDSSPDRNYVAITCEAGACIAKIDDQTKLLLPELKYAGVPRVQFGCGPYGKYCAVSTRDFGWQLYDIENGKVFRFVLNEQEHVACKSMTLAPDGSFVVITDAQNKCYVANLASLHAWRPEKHFMFRHDKRDRIRTLWTMAQARNTEGEPLYPQAELAKFPAELLDLLSKFIVAPGRSD